MMSSMRAPRSNRARCSPRTHRTPSEILDLPHPLGPTTAVTPSSITSSTVSAKDLNPDNCSRVNFMWSRCGWRLSAGEHPEGPPQPAAGTLGRFARRVGAQDHSIPFVRRRRRHHARIHAGLLEILGEVLGPVLVLADAHLHVEHIAGALGD